MEDLLPLLRSKTKQEILETLATEPLTPTIIAKKIKKPRPSISRAIIELQKNELIECTNPQKDRWRIYRITDKGRKILKKTQNL